MKLFKQTPSKIALLAILVLMANPSVGEAKKTKIWFLGNWYATNTATKFYEKLVNDFNHQSSDIEVKLTQGGDLNKLMSMIIAGTAPDVVEFNRYMVPSWAKSNLFAPVEKYMPRSINMKNDFLPNTIKDASWRGKIYAVPKTTDVRGLYWNKRLLEAAGLDSNKGPTTWEEFHSYAKKLSIKDENGKFIQAGFIPWAGNWFEMGWVFTFGGDYFDEGAAKPTFTRPENIAYLSWLSSWIKNDTYPRSFSGQFPQEKVAMECNYHGMYQAVWKKQNPKLQLGAGPMPHPTGGKNGTWGAGMSYVIPAGSKYKDAAGKFIAWLVSDKVQEQFASGYADIPATKSGVAIAEKAFSPLERTLMKQLPENNYWRPFTDVLWGYLAEAQSSVLNGKKSPEAALADAQQNSLKQHPALWKAISKTGK